jgi:hypothetical protein
MLAQKYESGASIPGLAVLLCRMPQPSRFVNSVVSRTAIYLHQRQIRIASNKPKIMSMRALRSATPIRQAARTRLVKPSNSEWSPNSALTLVRHYATEPTSSSNPNRYRDGLVKAALTGVGTGFVIAFVNDRGWLRKDVKCDGAPAITVTETHGAPWLPQNAIEADDPKVSLVHNGWC